MKVSEIPISLYSSVKLLLTPVKKIQNSQIKQIPVIVSLTTIPSRLRTVNITIRSLLAQNVLPEKIVLWLHDDYKEKIPPALKKICGSIFEIRFSPYTFSHRKLIHSLEAFPDSIIITCDDDLIYHKKSLELLYLEHLKKPNAVIGHRCRQISYNSNGSVKPYLKWPFEHILEKDQRLLMPVGAFCVLYPPNVLHEKVQDIALFNKLSPKSDDLWFKTMALLNNTLSIESKNKPPKPIPIIGTQFKSLKQINNKQDYKRLQWEQIIAHFNLKFNT